MLDRGFAVAMQSLEEDEGMQATTAERTVVS